MALVQRPLASVLAQPSIRTPRDLEGRRVGVTGLPSDVAVLRSVVAGAGGDPDRVRRVTIGFNAVQSLLARRVAGATAFWNVEGVALRGRAAEAGRGRFREFRLDDFGAPPYPELVLAATRTTLQDQPALVQRTVTALSRGYRFTLTDPQSSAQDLVAANPGLDGAEIDAQLDGLDSAFLGQRGRFGVLDRAALRRWAAWEARVGITRRPPDVQEMFAPSYAARAAVEEEG